jgi:hypothetical protein
MRLPRILLRRRATAASPLQQTRVDLFRTQVIERRIDQRPRRERETVSEQNRVNGEVRGLIPELWVAVAAATLVPQRAV